MTKQEARLIKHQEALLHAYLTIYNEYLMIETTMDPVRVEMFARIILEYPDFKKEHAKFIDTEILKKMFSFEKLNKPVIKDHMKGGHDEHH